MFCLKNQTALIRAEAGPHVGTRRVRRCLAIALSLKKFGVSSNFITSPLPRRLRAKITEPGFGLEEFEARIVPLAADVSEPSWLILDTFNVLQSQRMDSRGIGRLSFNKEEQGESKQITVDLGFSKRASLENDRLNGPEYFVVPESLTGKKQSLRSNAKQIIVVVEHANSLNRIIQAIKKTRIPGLTLIVVVAKKSIIPPEIEADLTELRCQLQIQSNHDRLESLLEFADLAIVDDWDVYWTALSMNSPALICGVENANPFLKDLSNLGIVIGPPCATPLPELAEQLRGCLRSRDQRAKLLSARQLIDESGADRIARALLTSMFSIRPCGIGDSETLHTWRNDPELRVISFQQEHIPYQSHQEWLTARLQSNKTEIYVIEDRDGKPVGQFRLEFEGRFETVRLHISLIPSLRGFGLGAAFIERAVRFVQGRYPDIEVYAYIKSVNNVSQSTFRKAGFLSVATTTISGQVAFRYCKPPLLKNFYPSLRHRNAA